MFSPYQLVLKYRKFVQVVVPALVAADTVHSLHVVHDLARQRLQDWEEEERQELVAATTSALRRVVKRCQANDADFWPALVSARAGVDPLLAAPQAPAAAGRVAGGDVMRQLLRTPPAASEALEDAPCISEPASPAPWEARWETTAELAAPPAAVHAPTRSGSSSSSRQQVVVYVTLNDLWAHLVQSVHCASAAAATHTARSSLLAGLGAPPRRLARRALAAADDARERFRGQMPWPQATLVRRSALRCGLEWGGLTWPIRPPPPPRCSLQMELTHL